MFVKLSDHSNSITMATEDYESDLDLFLDVEDNDSDYSLSISSTEESDVSDAEDTVTLNNDRWTRGVNKKAGPKSDFRGPKPGPTMDLPATMKELDFFFLFFTTQMLDLLMTQTHLYATGNQSGDETWTPISLDEMKAWLGMRVAMSVHQLPNINLYWSEDSLFGGIRIASVMTRDRFSKIAQYLHISDDRNVIPRGQPGHDKLHKIRQLMEMLRTTCFRGYNPNQNTSIDEAMVAFRGRLAFKQYLPAKPTKYGIKVWMRADPTNGYVNDFQVYTGKDGKIGEGGLGTRVVLDLIRPIKNRFHIVNCDNFFMSPHLCNELLKINTYARGTVRVNRNDFPRAILYQHTLKKQGDMAFAQKGEMVALAWKDKKVVHLLSTADSSSTVVTTVPRKSRDGSIHQVPSSTLVKNYNINMNGVDRADQIRTGLATYRTSKKWWQYMFWFIVDIAICNAFVLMRESPNHQLRTRRAGVKKRTMVQFRMALAKQLIGSFQSSRKRKRIANEDESGTAHWPSSSEKGRRCRQCSKTGARKTVKLMCKACDIGLCPDCFEPYHVELFK